jgi:hypothetical protein
VGWFVFCDGRAGLTFDAHGVPTRLQPAVFDDVARALDLAGQAGLRLVPVLFDFLWSRPASMVNGVQLGGRGALLADPARHEVLHETCVRPLVERFGADPRIAMWDLCNEPEWMARPIWAWRRDALSRRALRRWIAALAGTVRAASALPVTVGLASARGMDLAHAADVDVVQVHWYDRVQWHSALQRCPAPAGRPRPVVLGEFPSAGSRHTPGEILAIAREAGYAGAWGWSLLAQDSASSRDALLRALDTVHVA